MKKKITNILKRIILSGIMLYSYNQFAIYIGEIIPINFFSIGLVSLLGLPAIFVFLFFSLFCL